MSVIAMKITKAEQHPNADRLRVYEAQFPTRFRVHGDGEAAAVFPEDIQTIQFVANLTNVYEVGDIVAVAQVGTVLPPMDGEEGITISACKIRGVASFGMGLGKDKGPVGCNLDAVYGVV